MSIAAWSALVLALLAVLAPLAVLVHDHRRTVAPSTEAARALRHATLPAAVATAVLLLGVLGVATWVTAGVPALPVRPDGRAVACAPIAAALAFLLVHAVGELTYPRPSGDVRTADLTTRTVADVAPRPLRVLTWSWAGALVTLLAAGTLTATGPRHLDRVVDGWISRGTPYLGSWYAVPLTVGVVVLLAATAGVLHLVATRPAVGGVGPGWDLALRRRTGARILRGVQLALALTLAGALLMTSWTLHRVAEPIPTLTPATAVPEVAVLAQLVLVVAVSVGVAGTAVALRRGAAHPRTVTADVAAVA
ncbi:hypothetical protein [Cellulomonas phragmiteti]|uniref:hypothetical protein n=1 Tax=Cellulomonas phragmiteti TaxID=478780 RepID=UPI001944BA7D|nr:hypothetical protein [Cellulomonas phragmiteti]